MGNQYIRIIYANSVCVYSQRSFGQYLSLSSRPLFVLNIDEMTPEAAQKVIDQGLYRKLFCDIDRLESHRRTVRFAPPASIADKILGRIPRLRTFADYFGDQLADGAKEIFKDYEACTTNEEKREILENFYDSKVAGLNLKKLCKEIRKDSAQHSIIEPMNRWGTNFLAFETKLGNWPLLRKLISPLTSFFCQGLAVQESRSVERRDSYRAAISDITLLPNQIKIILNDIGIQIVLIHTNTYDQGSIGTSCYSHGYIEIRPESSPDVINEEIVHHLDSLIGFSKKREWIDAVAKDITPDNETLTAYYATHAEGKLTLFGGYSEDKRPAEALTDLHNIFRSRHAFPNILSDFPNTLPLYRQFMLDLNRLARKETVTEKDIRHSAAERETNYRQTVKTKRTGDISSLTRGSKKTEPAKRTNWGDSV